MRSPGKWRRVVIIRTDVSEERIAYVIRVNRISELETSLALNSSLILFTVMMEAIRSSETLLLTRATRRHIPEDGILKFIYLFERVNLK
jgi:hypothetical protein